MFSKLYRCFTLPVLAALIFFSAKIFGQTTRANQIGPVKIPQDAYRQVRTYINPVLAGDHPDPTLLKVGNDFYMCGSSFHFIPDLPILHSRDLLHWETISRVVPVGWPELKSGAPGAGIWQGAITYFYGSYRIYFSNGSGGGQYFCTATQPSGPWSTPVKVKPTATTGPTGYDNSIFVDDDGTPYMIIKPGQTTNRIQQIGRDGHLTGELINLDWINRTKQYSWAEGPVMCRRNGWYYYFMAGDVTGGQYALRSRTLTADSSKWESLGKVFAFSKDKENRFRSANHMSAPFRLSDGSWWCIAQSYDAPEGDDWSGQGRQDLLLRVQWDADGKPFVPYPSDQPLLRPALTNNGLPWLMPRSDDFTADRMSTCWHFLNKSAAAACSLTNRKGWLTIQPDTGRAHILQKEAGNCYTLVTQVDMNADTPLQEAGIYVTSGNEGVNARLFTGFDNGKKIRFMLGTQAYSLDNTIGETVWLKLERNDHELSGYCSKDGINWTQVGRSIDARQLDKTQANYNSWVGTSIGLYASGKTADFNLFLHKDGFSKLPLVGSNNSYGVKPTKNGVLTTSDMGGWLMLGGVTIGHAHKAAGAIELTATAKSNGKVEIWIDGLGAEGKKIATITIKKADTKGQPGCFLVKMPAVSGQHDVYLRLSGPAGAINAGSIKFIPR
ncbi:MAG TPA: family 43 glycosylhydrolase [Mucilaginibacter sp.]